jgi:putative phage-type endonuclease
MQLKPTTSLFLTMHPRVAELLEVKFDAQKSAEWLRLRGTMLTASDVATVIGLNPYERNSQSLLLKKCFKSKNAFKGNEYTLHGEKYESEARDLYCERAYDMGLSQHKNPKAFDLGLVQHPAIPWLGGSADGITEDGILLEIKCPPKREIKKDVPKHYVPQVQLLMEILDLEMCHFIQYKPAQVFGKEEFVVTEIKRDRGWFEKYLPIMKSFWDQVEQKRLYGLCDII